MLRTITPASTAGPTRHETSGSWTGSVAMAPTWGGLPIAYATAIGARMHSSRGRPVHDLLRGSFMSWPS